MAVLEETIDIAVIGAGHAGCEAALAAARMGLETVVFTVSVDSIAMMLLSENRALLKHHINCLGCGLTAGQAD